jgi:hypothetical protein
MQEGDCGVGSTVGAWGVAGHANLGGMPDHVSQHDRVLRAVPADRQRAAIWTALGRAGRDLAALAGQVRGHPLRPATLCDRPIPERMSHNATHSSQM